MKTAGGRKCALPRFFENSVVFSEIHTVFRLEYELTPEIAHAGIYGFETPFLQRLPDGRNGASFRQSE